VKPTLGCYIKKHTPKEIKDMDKALMYLKRLPENELRYIIARISQDLLPKAIAQPNNRIQRIGADAPTQTTPVILSPGVGESADDTRANR